MIDLGVQRRNIIDNRCPIPESPYIKFCTWFYVQIQTKKKMLECITFGFGFDVLSWIQGF